MTYLIINEIVEQIDAELSAALAHGMATGMLCANGQTQSVEWLNELFLHATPAAGEGKEALVHLFEDTQNLLADNEFEFDLFLPGDETLLSGRARALACWCQGFLSGVGFAGAATDFSRDVIEILKDIVEITKLDIEAEGEEDERNFMEITEYIRSAVLLLRYELDKGGEK